MVRQKITYYKMLTPERWTEIADEMRAAEEARRAAQIVVE